jgi:hypothetical protein
MKARPLIKRASSEDEKYFINKMHPLSLNCFCVKNNCTYISINRGNYNVFATRDVSDVLLDTSWIKVTREEFLEAGFIPYKKVLTQS